MYYFRLTKIIFCMTFLFIASCASVPDRNIQNLDGPLNSNDGIVVAESLNNSTTITGPLRDWKKLILWKIEPKTDDNNTLAISAVSNPSSSYLYAGSVPAGKYRVGLLWTSQNQGDVHYYARAFLPEAMGVFEVKPGHVTNLGTLIYHPFQVMDWTDREMPDYAMTRIPNDKLWDTLKLVKPAIATQIDPSHPILSWLPDEFDSQRAATEQLVKASAMPTELYPVDEDGIVMAGKLGIFYHRSEGQWKVTVHSWLRLPLNSQI